MPEAAPLATSKPEYDFMTPEDVRKESFQIMKYLNGSWKSPAPRFEIATPLYCLGGGFAESSTLGLFPLQSK